MNVWLEYAKRKSVKAEQPEMGLWKYVIKGEWLDDAKNALSRAGVTVISHRMKGPLAEIFVPKIQGPEGNAALSSVHIWSHSSGPTTSAELESKRNPKKHEAQEYWPSDVLSAGGDIRPDWQTMHLGKRVRIKIGPWAGVEGTLDEVYDDGSVLVGVGHRDVHVGGDDIDFLEGKKHEQSEKPIIVVQDPRDAKSIAVMFKQREIDFQSFSVPGRGFEFFVSPEDEDKAQSVLDFIGFGFPESKRHEQTAQLAGFRTGDRVNYGGKHGSVVRVGYSDLTVRLDDGEEIDLDYTDPEIDDLSLEENLKREAALKEFYAIFDDEHDALDFMKQASAHGATNVYGNTVQGQTEVHVEIERESLSLIKSIARSMGARIHSEGLKREVHALDPGESVWSALVKNFDLSEQAAMRLSDFLIGTPSPSKVREFARNLSKRNVEGFLTPAEADALARQYAHFTGQIATGESMKHEQVGQTIYQQLRGLDPMALMAWGAKDFVSFDNAMPIAGQNIGERGGGLMFRVNGPKFTGKIIIGLNFMDLYDVVAGKVVGTDFQTVKVVNDVYFDQLIEVIDGIVG